MASFTIDEGDRVACVGANGAGKTTLVRMLAGVEKPDHGTLRTEGTIRWFEQHPEIPPGATVQDLLAPGAPPAVIEKMAALERRISEPSLYETPGYEAVLEEHAAMQQQIKRSSGAARTDILDELGGLPLRQEASTLSGGEKTRLFLARTLESAEPGDILFLDEPTNHLDIESIEWLESWLDAYTGTIVLIAHDRAFLDNVATRVFEVNKSITCYRGDYEDYIEARNEERARKRRDRERAETRVADVKATVMQFRHQKRFDGQYASRMKALEKYAAALENTADPVMDKFGFGLSFGATQKTSNDVVRLVGIHRSFEETILNGAELEVSKGDRIGLVGANGAGKSTLLRIMTGRETKDAGTIQVAPGVQGAFFSQEHDDLEMERTVHDEVITARAMSDEDAKAIVGRFRFRSTDLKRKVSTLSGGERQRLMLLKCVLRPTNLLVLDEPTNHLDLDARDVVVRALKSYQGTIVVASHDRFLLDAVTTSTVVLDAGRLHRYPGSFSQTRRAQQTVEDATFVVRKRFTDWKAGRKYTRDEQVTVNQRDLGDSVSLRNAVQQGWLEKIE